MDRVEQMPVYQLPFELAVDVEKTTRRYGPDFRWLREQLLRASEPVCANMTEGFYAQYSTEYLQGLYRARREARETTTHIRYGMAVGQMEESVGTGLLIRYEQAAKQLAHLIISIERKIEAQGKSKANSFRVREGAEEYEADGMADGMVDG
jgi:four helix bundle protein